MRTTISIDDDLMMELRERSRKEKVSLARLVNRLLRTGLEASRVKRRGTRRHREEAYSMGKPFIDLTKALGVAAAMEDEEILRKMALRK